MARASIVNTAHRGSYVLEDYELRITQRCLSEDLGEDPKISFDDLRGHEIVKALVKDRATDPAAGKTVGPAAGAKTLFRLGYADHHRGATWWDATNRVVWLCAYHGGHRSGESDDSFPYFDELIEAGRIMPTEVDYERLFEDRDEEFDDFVLADAQELLSEARARPGDEIQGIVGGHVGAGVLVDVVDTEEEIFVVFHWRDISDQNVLFKLLAAFVPDSTWEQWRQSRFPRRDLDAEAGEVCFSYVKD